MLISEYLILMVFTRLSPTLHRFIPVLGRGKINLSFPSREKTAHNSKFEHEKNI